MTDPVLQIGPHVTALPVVHGSGDFAWEVRRQMLEGQFDCLAVPLPESFRAAVCARVLELPRPSLVLQRDELRFEPREWTGDQDEDDEPDHQTASFVPVDPCQPVIAAIRTALGERLPVRFIDLETSPFHPWSRSLPDPWALKQVPIEQFAASVVPFLEAPDDPQWRDRVAFMAWRLRELSVEFKRILFVCGLTEWPWVRAAFHDAQLQPVRKPPGSGTDSRSLRSESVPDPLSSRFPDGFPEPREVTPWSVPRRKLYFLLGELPYITDLYEDARAELGEDRTLGIDGIKALLIAARDGYRREYRGRARRITPLLLGQMLRYIRNLTLMQRCFTPQLATIVTAAKQVAGDGYAISVLETARKWTFGIDFNLPRIELGINQGQLYDGTLLDLASRLPGPPLLWTTLKLTPRPDERQKSAWRHQWNPYAQCSWPPEDEVIENFRQAVFDRAREVMGADLVRTEKFTTSIKDGVDIRETLRNWHKKEIHVRELPPARGKLDTAVMLFDSPADPRQYPWRTTWFAEHKNESTLAFYATNFADEPVGPGICLATYGGAMFVYPPVAIPDIWTDERLDFAETLEERLLGAACLHSSCRQIALLSSGPPGQGWRQLAKHFKKSWVWLPLARFSDSTIQQLRMVHVLNGKQIRSYAAQFIRKV